MDECCKTCTYYCEVRKKPTFQEILTHICVLWAVKDNEDYILETYEDDVCEAWVKRKD